LSSAPFVDLSGTFLARYQSFDKKIPAKQFDLAVGLNKYTCSVGIENIPGRRDVEAHHVGGQVSVFTFFGSSCKLPGVWYQ